MIEFDFFEDGVPYRLYLIHLFRYRFVILAQVT